MKNNKHIQSFNEHQENLNISNISESKLINFKGIYLTQEGKKAIEDRIAELEIWSERNAKVGQYDSEGQVADELKDILSSSTILPVEESWADFNYWTTGKDCPKDKKTHYPNGVIIQPKQ
jgi:hypothetical protein